MFGELAIDVECLAASFAFEQLIAGVHLFVGVQRGLAAEFLAAHLALERLFARVRANVAPAIVHIRECFVAKEANIWIAAGRDYIEIVRSFEREFLYGAWRCWYLHGMHASVLWGKAQSYRKLGLQLTAVEVYQKINFLAGLIDYSRKIMTQLMNSLWRKLVGISFCLYSR